MLPFMLTLSPLMLGDVRVIDGEPVPLGLLLELPPEPLPETETVWVAVADWPVSPDPVYAVTVTV